MAAATRDMHIVAPLEFPIDPGAEEAQKTWKPFDLPFELKYRQGKIPCHSLRCATLGLLMGLHGRTYIPAMSSERLINRNNCQISGLNQLQKLYSAYA